VELLPLLLTFARLANCAGDRVTPAQAVLAHQRQRHVDVVGPGEVTGRAHERVVIQDIENPRDGQQHVVLADLQLTAVPAVRALPPAAAVAITETPATTAAAVVIVLTGTALVLAVALLALLVLLTFTPAGLFAAAGGSPAPVAGAVATVLIRLIAVLSVGVRP